MVHGNGSNPSLTEAINSGEIKLASFLKPIMNEYEFESIEWCQERMNEIIGFALDNPDIQMFLFFKCKDGHSDIIKLDARIHGALNKEEVREQIMEGLMLEELEKKTEIKDKAWLLEKSYQLTSLFVKGKFLPSVTTSPDPEKYSYLQLLLVAIVNNMTKVVEKAFQ